VSKPRPPRALGLPRVLILNGVNLDLLGRREAQHYGSFTLEGLEAALGAEAPALARAAGLPGVELSFAQSNSEDAFLAVLDKGWDGAVLNAGAWTHTSLAIADRLRALGLIFVEAHISNIAAREEFRQRSFLAPVAAGVVYGFGMDSYRVALFGLLRRLAQATVKG
jgi:3-dehydroquinate dehydratase-2